MENNHHDPESSALRRDLQTLRQQKWNRRKIFAWMGAGAALPLAASVWKAGSLKAAAACKIIPTETAGPYPGDASNGKNCLTLEGIVRRDITASVDTSTTVAEGVPLRVELTILNAAGDCEPLEGYAVYIWACDRAGDYSMYTGAAKAENYCRGVQATDADGLVIFDTIFPACYQGRWPHVHFEVYQSLEAATSYKKKLATSQLALPSAPCKAVYATKGYEKSVKNLANISLAKDMVFADGTSLQLASTSGSVEEGYVAKLVVAIKA